MKSENNKVSVEFLCGNCRQYKLKSEKRKTVPIHCASCESKIADAKKGTKDKPVTVSSQATIDARAIRQRAADLMLEIEYKRINGNHLADYL